ncbi:outer membrane lipoprotein carrier protein LolA [Paenarthrobacter sp. NPDC057355]|uniref:LolA family protein n=1 Tax=Paenarthrobacter sp. NPDC057355 TaxID=3346105 RepID=UPI003638991A
MSRARQRWLPALLICLAMGMAVLFGAVQAGASSSLPPKTADEVLAMIANTQVRALAGTVEQNAELGLPDIPAAGPGVTPGVASALEFLTGSHTARVYLDAPAKARLQILDRMAERDLVVNGRDAWFYNSADNSATHLSAPSPSMGRNEDSAPYTDMPTPGSLAARFLAAIDASTEVSVDNSSTVAGRSAYRLLLSPRTSGTLVDSVAIDVDSETGMPLGVEVRAKGQAEPAYSLAFTQVELRAPDAAIFEFTPPPGATVTEKAVPAAPAKSTPLPSPQATHGQYGAAANGKGWDAVVSLPAGTAPAGLMADPLLSQALQPVPGGHAVTTSLVSVLILDDGRVFAGMVPLERLQTAALQPAAPNQ